MPSGGEGGYGGKDTDQSSGERRKELMLTIYGLNSNRRLFLDDVPVKALKGFELQIYDPPSTDTARCTVHRDDSSVISCTQGLEIICSGVSRPAPISTRNATWWNDDTIIIAICAESAVKHQPINQPVASSSDTLVTNTKMESNRTALVR